MHSVYSEGSARALTNMQLKQNMVTAILLYTACHGRARTGGDGRSNQVVRDAKSVHQPLAARRQLHAQRPGRGRPRSGRQDPQARS